jgi:four helix bundle protein
MRDFRYLDVGHKAHAFTLSVYRVTENFPKTETFGLSANIRRSSMNLPLKIAEGCGRDENHEYISCLRQARATGMEVEYLLLLARDLQFMEETAYKALQAQVTEVRKMLSGLMK